MYINSLSRRANVTENERKVIFVTHAVTDNAQTAKLRIFSRTNHCCVLITKWRLYSSLGLTVFLSLM